MRYVLLVIAVLFTGCAATPPPLAIRPTSLPTAAILAATPTVPALATRGSHAPEVAAAAPHPELAAASAALIDTPVLESTPSPAPVLAATEPAPPTPPPALPAPRRVTRIVIDDIGLDREAVAVGVDSAGHPIVPKHDVAWFTQSAAPGGRENIVLWGHAIRFRDAPDIPAPFGRLSELTLGAPLVLFDEAGVAHQYTVTRQIWATPDQVDFILPQGSERVTLVSCIGDRIVTDGVVTSMTHRLITIAEPA